VTTLLLLYAAAAVGALTSLPQLTLLVLASRGRRPGRDDDGMALPLTVIIPCFNEETVLGRTVDAIFRSQGALIKEVVCVDDGSTDRTAAVMTSLQRRHGPAVRVIRQRNSGKAVALNAGVAHVSTPCFVTIDADTQVLSHTLHRLSATLGSSSAAAVSGQLLIGNRHPRNRSVLSAQIREYENANNIERRALSLLKVVGVVPGAIGAFRTDVVRESGGYPTGTLAEDADLTLELISRGRHVVHEPRAVVVTEAPDELSGLLSQRTRWATGKMQVLWRFTGRLSRASGALRLLWLHMALTEAVLPLLGPLVVVGMPVCLAVALHGVLTNRLGTPAIIGLVVVAAVMLLQALLTIVTARAAHRWDAPPPGVASLPQAGAPIRSMLLLTMVRFVAVARAWRTLLGGHRPAWNKLERTGDVPAVSTGDTSKAVA